MKIIHNNRGIASGKIYNIGHPKNILSVKQLAQEMVKLALQYPEYQENAKKVRLITTSSGAYYGKGYQDIQNRVPKITNACAELSWKPKVTVSHALKNIFDFYIDRIRQAQNLNSL